MSNSEPIVYNFPPIVAAVSDKNPLATNTTYAGGTRGSVTWLAVENPGTAIPNAFKTNPLLNGQVAPVGTSGWMKFIIPKKGKYKITCMGASGGNSGLITISTTGVVTGNGFRPGRGGKLIGTCVLEAGSVLYIQVGHRGCPANSASGGACGGGASSVLLVDPNGTLTFGATNEKVTPLFCAGGGGGASTYSSSATATGPGKDAVLSNATSGAGGTTTSTGGGGGCGMTGNGAIGGYPKNFNSTVMKPLISGSATFTTSNIRYVGYGAWGGGAPKSSSGGGGGGGYKGGNGGTTNTGGSGGQCYVDLTKVTDIERSYPTAIDTANPYASHGFVSFELLQGRDEDKLILAHDSDGYKWFNGAESLGGDPREDATNTWELLPNQDVPQPDTYLDYGATKITSANGLQNQVKFLIRSKEAQEKIEIEGYINAAWIKQTNSVSIADVSLIKTMSLISSNLTNLDVKFAVSKNDGKTYQTYNAGQWIDIAINDKEYFMNNAYSLNDFTSIPIEHWNDYAAKTIRFIFCVTQIGAHTGSVIGYLQMVADLVGSWRHYKESEATYEYISDTALRITFLQDGNYKVNYLDSLNSSD